MLAVSGLSLIAGIWGGLLRLGWPFPVPSAAMISDHGGLMVCGFLGTLIAVERAVALGQWWAYAAPVLTGLGSLGVVLGVPWTLAVAAIVLGSFIFLAASTVVVTRRLANFTVTMALGAMTWVIGNVLWLMGRPVFELVLWWAAFLLLTIAGERLELSRIVRGSRWAAPAFVAVCGLFGVGVVAGSWWPDAGARVAGAGLFAIAFWLARHDAARRTVRQAGLTRYVAVCLLSGYVWLAVSGAILLALGPLAAGLRYDAFLHTFFVGFVFSMIFGHAPIIFPAVLGISVGYRPVFYVPLALLHGSLLVRAVGDLGGVVDARLWGGTLNAVAIVFFLATIATAAYRGGRARGGHGRNPGHAEA